LIFFEVQCGNRKAEQNTQGPEGAEPLEVPCSNKLDVMPIIEAQFSGDLSIMKI